MTRENISVKIIDLAFRYPSPILSVLPIQAFNLAKWANWVLNKSLFKLEWVNSVILHFLWLPSLLRNRRLYFSPVVTMWQWNTPSHVFCQHTLASLGKIVRRGIARTDDLTALNFLTIAKLPPSWLCLLIFSHCVCARETWAPIPREWGECR